jgi:hypothetical protein
MSTLSVNTIQPLSGTTVTIPSDLTVTGNILLVDQLFQIQMEYLPHLHLI